MESTTTTMSPEVQARQENLNFLGWWMRDQGHSEIRAHELMYQDLQERVDEAKAVFDTVVGRCFKESVNPDEITDAHEKANHWIRQAEDALKLLRMALQKEAREANIAYPQYDGMFDSWVVGQVNLGFSTKGGLQANDGDYVLTDPEEHTVINVNDIKRHRTFRSRRSRSQVSDDTHNITIL